VPCPATNDIGGRTPKAQQIERQAYLLDGKEEEFDILCCVKQYDKKVKQSLYTPWRRLGGEEV
jgi:hypothetical protein